MSTIHINAVAFQEGDVWVIQGIEYDISTHTQYAEDIPKAFLKAVTETACITKQLGREILAGVKPAPAKFKAMFDLSSTSVSAVGNDFGSFIPISGLDIRLGRELA